jgi:hypothetical protein
MSYDFVTFECSTEMSLMLRMVTSNKKKQNRWIALNQLELCQLFLGPKVK